MQKRYVAYLLIITLIISLSVGCTQKENEDNTQVEQENYVPVEVQNVSLQTIYNEVTFSGKVYPEKDVMVIPKIPGKVTKVNVAVGDKVVEGEILFTLDKSDVEKQVETARVALEGAQVSYELNKEKIENAQANLERAKKLYEEGAISESQFEQSQLAASDKSLEALTTQINQAQLAYNQAVDALNNLTIKAPTGGVIASVNIETGEMASNAQPAVTIVDVNRIYVQINVPENIINDLEVGQEVEAKVESASSDIFKGQIDSISPSADARTQLYQVKIYIDSQDNKVKPGMFAQTKLKIDQRENALVVNSEAVVQKNGETVAYVVNDDRAVEKPVAIGLDTGSHVEILSGLNKGDKIIIKGQNYVEDGTTVKVVRGDK
ncbi:efflux RND transporter periplasmic adaptor subunit [Brassicibacter mesophilus]|uniref:efflux RND transporter periplasmic adaptor subunit n=1 Tax=Brassicibacter mesophilus TaxID=745119 RepID=UPI003D22BCA1